MVLLKILRVLILGMELNATILNRSTLKNPVSAPAQYLPFHDAQNGLPSGKFIVATKCHRNELIHAFLAVYGGAKLTN